MPPRDHKRLRFVKYVRMCVYMCTCARYIRRVYSRADVYEETRERAYGREYLRRNVERGRINNAAFPRCAPAYARYIRRREFM